ncbi:Glyoxalase/Bleomycin resistance protein/Dihydroxybiphenyl dioxygenase [Xylariomycetidae sp. FL2044]|nr:Glyoxalase/Bleomycin resistance protein/Dihydroxybiphenyl dioxygenase [Xylariomycetidae sp. FL2044]
MPLSHISLATGAASWAAMRAFYLTSLAPLGYVIYYEKADSMLGLKPKNGFPDFWLHAGNGEQEKLDRNVDLGKRPGRAHVAFDADSPEVVDQWYAAAIKAGGLSNGGPGLRREYSEPYYAAFVLDPLGNNIEAVHYRTTRF